MSSAATRSRQPGLDVLRGVAATGVVVTHVAFASGVVNPERWSSDLRLVLPRLDVGVPIFFVLSGLLISRPFVAAAADGERMPAPGHYLARRFARIYPLYWCVLGVALGTATGALPPARELLSYVTLTHIYRPSTAIGPITQSWSLATEISFYVFVPLWFGLCRRVLDRRGVTDRAARLRWMLVALASWLAVALAWRAAVVTGTNPGDVHDVAGDTRGALLTWLPNHLDNFGAGVALAILIQLRPSWRMRPTARLGAYAGAAVSLWVVSAYLDLPPVFTGFDGPQTFARHALFLVTATLVVAPSALAPPAGSARNLPGKRVVGRVAAGIGLGSYGVYLWHQWVTAQWFDRPSHPEFQAPFTTTFLFVLVVSAALAGAGYWLVERWPQRMVDAVHRAGRPGERPAPRALGQAPALDGLRGLSILAVLGTHFVFVAPEVQGASWYERWWPLKGGFLGVDVFLALSGFLITATLLRERDRTGAVSLPSFLGRRGRRLIPPMAAFFAIHAVVTVLLGRSTAEEAWQSLLALSFVTNWQLTFGHHPPFDLVHLWSLAVEGQLYVACGLAVFWGRRHLDRLRGVVAWLVAGALAVALWRMAWFAHGTNVEALYERTDLRADSMIIGGLGAVLWRARMVPERVARVVGAAGGLAIVAAWVWFETPDDAFLFGGGFTLIAAASVAAILATLAAERSPVRAVAGLAPLRAIGRVSYSLYLWHLPIYIWTNDAIGGAAPLLKFAVAVGASFVAAYASYRFVEMPFLRRRRAAAQEEQSRSLASPETVMR